MQIEVFNDAFGMLCEKPEYPFPHKIIYTDEKPDYYQGTTFSGYMIEDNTPAAWKMAGHIADRVRAIVGQDIEPYVAVIRQRPEDDETSGQPMRSRGEWSADESYLKGDLVTNPENGVCYIALKDNSQRRLDNKKFWDLLFAK